MKSRSRTEDRIAMKKSIIKKNLLKTDILLHQKAFAYTWNVFKYLLTPRVGIKPKADKLSFRSEDESLKLYAEKWKAPKAFIWLFT